MAFPTLKEFRRMKGDLEARIYNLIEQVREGEVEAGSIETEDLADGSVSLAKMDDLDEGKIIIGDETDRPSTQLLSELIPEGGSGDGLIPTYSIPSVSGDTISQGELATLIDYAVNLDVGYIASVFNVATGASYLAVVHDVEGTNMFIVYEGAIPNS